MAPHRLISQDSYDKVFFVRASSHVKENNFLDTTDNQEMEKTIDKFMQESPIKAIDDHLIEFAEAMRTIAKVLRQAAEAKAAAQTEAAEWKRKYEFERASNQQNTHEGLF